MMNNEKTIKICGQDVRVRYCAAAENGFELLAAKKMKDLDFESMADLTRLSVAAIVAAYEHDGEECPITSQKILYDARPAELTELYKAVLELRAAWYEVPLVLEGSIKAEQEDGGEQQKNS